MQEPKAPFTQEKFREIVMVGQSHPDYEAYRQYYADLAKFNAWYVNEVLNVGESPNESIR